MDLFKSTGAVLSGLVLTVLSSCGGEQQAQQQGQAPELAVMTVGVGDSELNRSYPATIKGKADIDIRPQVSGFITRVHVDEGQRVSKGQTLFTLDQVQFKAAVDQAQAAVNQTNAAIAQAQAALNVAETAVATAQLTANNKKTLYEKNIISKYEWDLAENSLAQAKANLNQAKAGISQAKAAHEQAKASLVSAKKNLSYTVVTAPSNGVVGSIPNRVGALASPSMQLPLTTVSDNTSVYVYFALNEKDIIAMTKNGAISLEQAIASMPRVNLRLADGSIYGCTGEVATVSGVIDASTGSATVRALFDNPAGMLRSGSTGTVLIPYVENDAIIIPQKATFEIQDRKFVYTLNDSNKTVSTPITVFEINDGQEYRVTSGLKAGDRIVTEGIGTTVKEGMVIKPKTAAPVKQPAQSAQQAPAKADSTKVDSTKKDSTAKK
ncbi:MAG: efflux RND transporter periplasmic adaptor subunit [Muribaculaceae bacterium]|nr:efflux RND transporter periplasmic adaptor subunit [Muribaculaceae bacterium]